MTHRKPVRTTLAIVLLTLIAVGSWPGSVVAAPRAWDQEASATVSGTIVDSTGAAIGTAKITVVNESRGIRRASVTNDEGFFVVPFLLPGIYTVTIEMPGFGSVRITGLAAQAGMNSRIEIALQAKGAVETITIQARNNRVETSDATLRYSITQEQVAASPVIATSLGRSLLNSVALVIPGVSPGFDLRGEDLIVNGSRPQLNVFMLDGGDNNDYELNRAGAPLPNPDALQEITVVTNNFKADLPGGAGGLINAVTKSGTNELHGNLRYLISNEALNARDFFLRADLVGKQRDRLNTIGGQLGGPVVLPRLYSGKDRTHFFFDFEQNRTLNDYPFVNLVLAAAERAGDFSARDSDSRPIDPLTGEPFPNGRIPANRIDPLAQLYLDHFIPKSNFGEDEFRFASTADDRNTQATVRLDHRLGDSDSFTATYLFNRFAVTQVEYDLVFGHRTRSVGSHTLVARWTHAISAATVNQVTGTLNGLYERNHDDAPGFTGVRPSDAGFKIQPQTDKFLSLPAVSISSGNGGINIDTNSLSFFGLLDARADVGKKTLAFKDDLTQSRGNHRLGLGGSLRIFRLRKFDANNNGRFHFGDNEVGRTGIGVADFLLGLPAFYLQTTGSSQYGRQWSISPYVMDDWRVRPNLTLNLGLRYELTPPIVDKLNQVTVFRPGQKSERFPRMPEGQLFAGDPDPILGRVPRGGYPTDKNNLAPRLGLAFSPNPRRGWLHTVLGDGLTSLRAGIGMFYGPTFGGNFSDFSFIPPFSSSVFLNNLSAGDEGQQVGSFSDPFGANPNPFPISLEDRDFFLFSAGQTTDPSFRTSYSYHYNFTIQRELPWSLLAEAGYVGSASFKTERQRDLNPLTSDPRSVGNFTQPFPQFDYLVSQESSGRARYDSLELRLSRRFRDVLFLDGSYTFSKALDDASSPRSVGGLADQFRAQAAFTGSADDFLWARSSFDRRHSFAISYVYTLPKPGLGGVADALLGGLRIGGVTQLRSGFPLEIFGGTPVNAHFRTARADLVGPFRRLNPREVQTFEVEGRMVTGNFLFDPTAFGNPGTRTGSLGRNVISGPGVNLTSLSLARSVRIRRQHEAELRADIRNIFNHANFYSGYQYVNDRRFGQALYTLPARRIQLSLRYRF
jgi:hypothetical protein